MFGLRFGKLGAALRTIWNPRTALFSNGEIGVIFDPSDMSTMFTDSAGTTPVTAVEQPVGLILDKSGNGKHASQATSASRPVLSARVNQLLASASMATQNVTTIAIPYTLQHTGTGTITLSGTSTAGPLVGAGTLTFTPTAGTLTLTVTGTVTDAQLETGSTATRYQAITTSTDYDTVGFPHFLKFDGVDDSLATASIDFTATDKMTVVAGVRKLVAGDAIVVEQSANWNTNAGTFVGPNPSTASNYIAASRGSTSVIAGQFATASGYTAPHTAVLTTTHSIVDDLTTLRVNTVAAANATGDKGTGNFGNYPLYIGRRGGTSLPFNGHLYSLIIRGAQSTDAQIVAAETWTNLKTGAY